jgi:hypothetical protein
MSDTDNGFGVQVREETASWRVRIVDVEGRPLAERVCADAAEARTYASTVRQHIHWLSEERFRDYYGL